MPRPQVTIETIGVRWRLDLGALPEEMAASLEALWARARVADDPDAPTFTVATSWDDLGGSVGTTVSPDPASAPYDLSRAVTLESMRRQRGRLMMIHAAGLSSLDGERAVMLVARSGGGKSTATTTLGTRLGYLSDETVAVTDELTIVPYAKPLSVMDGTVAGTKAEYAPDALGLGPTPRRARLAAVVELDRQAEATTPALVPDSLVAGLLHLVAQSSSLLLLDEPLQRLTRIAVAGGGPFLLRYAEIADCAALVEASLDAAEEPPTWTAHVPPADRYLAPKPVPENDGPDARLEAPEEARLDAADDVAWDDLDLTSGTMLWRSRWTDAVESEGEVIVLRDRAPLHLAGIGATAWIGAQHPVTIGELAERIVTTHGPNEDAERIIKHSLTAMVEAGALVVVRDT